MNRSDKQFQELLLLTFKAEATGHLGTIASGLIEFEKAPVEKQNELIETIFREAHCLKGAVNSVNDAEVVMLCQSMENVFAAVKRKELAVSPPLFDLIHQTADAISRLISAKNEPSAAEKSGLENSYAALAKSRRDFSVVSTSLQVMLYLQRSPRLHPRTLMWRKRSGFPPRS